MNTTVQRESAALSLRMPVGIDPQLVADLIGELLSLLQGCFPDPTPDAVARLAEPPYGLVGFRQWLWERDIRKAVARAWNGPTAMLPAAQQAVIGRLRAGVSVETLRSAYGVRP